jgi:hypothetical protein
MMTTEQKRLKRRIVTFIKRSGLPVGTQYLGDHIMLPEHIVLDDLLSELVAEGRLIKSYTLLVNGEAECTYNLVS